MTPMARRLGFGISLLVHLGLAGGLWLWQQRAPSHAAVQAQAQAVPVQLTMFAQAPPAPAPTAEPRAAPEPRAEPAVTEATEAPAEPQPRPELPLVAAPAMPQPKPKSIRKPAEPQREQAKPRPDPVAAREPDRAATPPAAAPMPAAPAAPAAAAAPRSAQRVALREAYKAELLAAIERHKFYPNRARRRRIEGQVLVGFRIAADGTLGDIRLVAGSGARVLDQAALETLRRLAQVAPLPPVLKMDEWVLVVPIAFELR